MGKITVGTEGMSVETTRYELPEWVEAMYYESQQNPDPLSREIAYRTIRKYLPYIRFNLERGRL